MWAPKLLIKQWMIKRGVHPSLLARSCSIPTREVMRLIQDDPPHHVRLAVLGVIAMTLEVQVADLFADAPRDLVANIEANNRSRDDTDTLADLEREWAAEFDVEL